MTYVAAVAEMEAYTTWSEEGRGHVILAENTRIIVDFAGLAAAEVSGQVFPKCWKS